MGFCILANSAGDWQLDVKVKDAEWAAFGKDEQTRIEGIITGFFKGSRIVPDKGTARSVAQPQALSNPLCTAACNIAQAAASAACVALGNPIAIAACIAATQAAGDLCRSKC